ncbi:hypothetical protein [Chitinophaga niastensis]|uniref:hypothetical protein n=1 Tax=Chitinophaga niastensis TaxID=536980 RepID=UPI0011B256DF|nr:hypothetical protein [Chitinophaga niastensis]
MIRFFWQESNIERCWLRCREGAGRYVAEKFTTNKFAAYRPRRPDQAFYLQLTERKTLHLTAAATTVVRRLNVTGTGSGYH